MISRAALNPFAGRMLPAGRTFDTPALDGALTYRRSFTFKRFLSGKLNYKLVPI